MAEYYFIVLIYHILFIHSFIGGHFGCLYFLAMMNILCGHNFLFSFLFWGSIYLGVEVLSCAVLKDIFQLLSLRPGPCPFWALHSGSCYALAQTPLFSLARVGRFSSPNTPRPHTSCLFTCHPPLGWPFSDLSTWATPPTFSSGITTSRGFYNEQRQIPALMELTSEWGK